MKLASLVMEANFIFLFQILGLILDAGFGKSLLALYTRTALSAMLLATLIATPGLRVVYSQSLAYTGNVRLGDVGIRR